MIKKGLVLCIIMLVLFSSVYAASQYVKTKIIFNILSNPEFTIQVNNNTWSTSLNQTSESNFPPTNSTLNLTFVSLTGNSDCIYPNTDYSTNPTFRFYNTGNEDLSFSMMIDSFSSTGTITLFYDNDTSCGDGTPLTTSWSSVLFNLPYGESKDVWLYANFTDCPSSDSGIETWLYTNGTVIS